mgnify:FL=1
MELRHLRYFLAVAQELSFTRAAERVGIAQPPLSYQITNLEHELGTPLFNRTRRSVALTPAGEALVPYAKLILNLTENAASSIKALGSGQSGTLRVGALFSTIYTFLPAVIQRFRTIRPDVKLLIQQMTVKEQLAALQDGTIDVGLLRGPPETGDLKARTLANERFMAAIPHGHPLGDQDIVSLDALVQQPFLMISSTFNRDFTARVRSMLSRYETNLHVVEEVTDIHALIGLVAAGLGVTLVPESISHIRPEGVRFRAISGADMTIPLNLVWLSDSYAPPREAFVSCAEEVAADRFGQTPPGDDQ